VSTQLGPFGIISILVEPGFFNTDFLDGSSISYGDNPMDEYAAFLAEI
jgi:hypothetical protein